MWDYLNPLDVVSLAAKKWWPEGYDFCRNDAAAMPVWSQWPFDDAYAVLGFHLF